MRNRNNNNNNNNNITTGPDRTRLTRVFDVQRPDIQIRGPASHVRKNVQWRATPAASGDQVAAEKLLSVAGIICRLLAAPRNSSVRTSHQPATENEISSEEATTIARAFRIRAEPGLSRRSSRRSCRGANPRAISSADGQPYQAAERIRPRTQRQ